MIFIAIALLAVLGLVFWKGCDRGPEENAPDWRQIQRDIDAIFADKYHYIETEESEK